MRGFVLARSPTNRVSSNRASNVRHSFKRVCFARIERNSRNATQPYEAMTFIRNHRNVFAIARKLIPLFKPDRFDEAFDSESREHWLRPNREHFDWRFARASQSRPRVLMLALQNFACGEQCLRRVHPILVGVSYPSVYLDAGFAHHGSMKSPACSCVSITLPASSQTRITARCEKGRKWLVAK